jgi:hypothetical protein
VHAHLHTVVTFCFQILLTSVRKEFRKRDQTNSIEEVEREVQQQIIETLQLGTYVECLIWYGYHWTRTSNDILLQRYLVLLWVFNDHNLISSCFFRESDSRNIAITRVVSIKGFKFFFIWVWEGVVGCAYEKICSTSADGSLARLVWATICMYLSFMSFCCHLRLFWIHGLWLWPRWEWLVKLG